MTKPAKESPPIYVMRRGLTLVPEMLMDADAIERMPANERIKVDLRTGRQPKRLRYYWKLLGKLVKATDCAPSAEALHEVVKLELGYVIHVRISGGIKAAIPGSIAFDRMTESEFTEFLDRAVEWIGMTYGVTAEEIMGPRDNREAGKAA